MPGLVTFRGALWAKLNCIQDRYSPARTTIITTTKITFVEIDCQAKASFRFLQAYTVYSSRAASIFGVSGSPFPIKNCPSFSLISLEAGISSLSRSPGMAWSRSCGVGVGCVIFCCAVAKPEHS